MTHQAWEKVYTVNDYHDGPRLGVANLRGKPHIYQKEFSEALDNYTDSFWLREIDQHLLTLVLEDWAICCAGRRLTNKEVQPLRVIQPFRMTEHAMTRFRYSLVISSPPRPVVLL